jgi:hypothetical protein
MIVIGAIEWLTIAYFVCFVQLCSYMLRYSSLGWNSFIITTVGDELAATYHHTDFCLNADYLHVKAFYDDMFQSGC